jgi:biopolymer transport protein ExbD
MNFRQKNRAKLDITLTPMIDVVFLLLIFFMVTTTFSRETQIKIKLPEAEGEERDQQPKVIALTIDANGIYYVNDHQVINQKPATLKKAIIDAAGNSRALPFVISADAKTPYQAVITALDIASQAGFSRITFAAERISN